MGMTILYSVDRIENGFAVLVDDEGVTKDVALTDLPEGTEERMMLRYANGVYTPDETARQAQADRIKALQDRLRKRK